MIFWLLLWLLPALMVFAVMKFNPWFQQKLEDMSSAIPPENRPDQNSLDWIMLMTALLWPFGIFIMIASFVFREGKNRE